jgi:hypothetical protein
MSDFDIDDSEGGMMINLAEMWPQMRRPALAMVKAGISRRDAICLQAQIINNGSFTTRNGKAQGAIAVKVTHANNRTHQPKIQYGFL